MIAISRELHNNNDDDGNGDNIQQQLPPINAREPNDLDMMFDDLNEYYMEQQQQQGHNAADAQEALNNNNLEQHRINLVEAELLLYQQEPSIRLYKEGSTFNCPFSWWKVNKLKFPLLSELVHWLLSIPATSAPSERVFSSAGHRARLAPETANELVFLHEAMPALELFEGRQRTRRANN